MNHAWLTTVAEVSSPRAPFTCTRSGSTCDACFPLASSASNLICPSPSATSVFTHAALPPTLSRVPLKHVRVCIGSSGAEHLCLCACVSSSCPEDVARSPSCSASLPIRDAPLREGPVETPGAGRGTWAAESAGTAQRACASSFKITPTAPRAARLCA